MSIKPDAVTGFEYLNHDDLGRGFLLSKYATACCTRGRRGSLVSVLCRCFREARKQYLYEDYQPKSQDMHSPPGHFSACRFRREHLNSATDRCAFSTHTAMIFQPGSFSCATGEEFSFATDPQCGKFPGR